MPDEPPLPPPRMRFVLDTHTVCTAPDGSTRWEADTAPVTVDYRDLSPELRMLADRIIEEEDSRGRD